MPETEGVRYDPTNYVRWCESQAVVMERMGGPMAARAEQYRSIATELQDGRDLAEAVLVTAGMPEKLMLAARRLLKREG